ncbi:MAG: hypothetical protein ACK4ZW_07620 [Blastomonas sp.]
MLDRLLSDHEMIRQHAQGLLDLLACETMPSSLHLADARWKLGSKIMQHMAFEDRHLYAKLLRDERPHVRAIGLKFQSELTKLFSAYSEHAQFWTPERIAQDWNGFRLASIRMTHAMFARLALEEAELYPLANDAAIDIASNVPPDTNWTREAFAIKDAITHQPRGAAG